MTDDIFAKYEQAQILLQGLLSKRLVLNDAVFPHWIGDSDCFWYQRETLSGKEYRLVDAKAGSNHSAFDHQTLATVLGEASGQHVTSKDLPITDVDITLLPRQVHFKAFAKKWVFESTQPSCREVETHLLIDGFCSPDGTKAAFIKNYNLWVRDLASGNERALTIDGTSECAYATAATPFGASNMATLQAIWSPDSQRLITYKLDNRRVASRSVVSHVPQHETMRPQLLEFAAAYPDDKQSTTYNLLSINVNNNKIKVANYEPLSLCRLGAGFFTQEQFGWWSNDSRQAFFLDVARGAKEVSIVEWDTHTGATRVLFKETSDTFVKLSHGILERPLFLPMPDSNELIWFSERSGWAHLYLYDLSTGKLKNQITKGDWLVRNVLHVDIKRRELLVQTAARNPGISPYYRDICCVNIDTGTLMPVVAGAYEYVVFCADSGPVIARSSLGLDTADVNGISPSGNYLVTTRSRVDTAPVTLLIDREGKELLTLETADPFGLPTDWQWPEPVALKSADGNTDLYGVVYRPPGFSPDQSYPVLDFSSAHPGFSYVPHAAFVNGPFLGESYLKGAAFASLGFVVVAIEVPGMPYRDKAFQDKSYGRMSSANSFLDRMAGLRQLAKENPYMDLNQVGIVGCDGITGPVYGLLEYPEFYKVGVMIALEDPRFGAASMVEMFEGINPQPKIPYSKALGSSLQGKLLLIHGMLDTVTPPEATFCLLDVLQQANKDFDVLLLPNDGHAISSYMLRRTWDYIVTHLHGLEPPKEFKLTTTWDLLSK